VTSDSVSNISNTLSVVFSKNIIYQVAYVALD